MATPLDDIIRNLRTAGGSQGEHSSFEDARFVIFDTKGEMTSREAAFAKLAFFLWGDLIDIPFFLGGTNPQITLEYDSGLKDTQAGLMRQIGDHRYVLINRNLLPESSTENIFDTSRFSNYIHEIGHALGLTHPGSYNGEGAGTSRYPEDLTRFTVMSYFNFSEADPFNLGAGGPTTPMLHDIAAIQSIYGANMLTRNGDTTYGFGSNNERSFDGVRFDPYDFAAQPGGASFTIWDGGGIDTINASEFRAPSLFGQEGRFPNQVIDLREGHFSDVGITYFEGASFGMPLKKNISIAYGVTIENAIGGGGHDGLVGNAADNHLVGNDGNDLLFGGDGEDTLEGNDDDDTLQGENGNDTLAGGAGEDLLRGGNGNDLLDGGDGNDIIEGNDGNDVLISGGGTRDILDGGNGFDTARYTDRNGINYRPSKQSFFGSSTGDVFISIEAFDLTEGKDAFEGREERDVIDGNGGDDTLHGFGGDDLIRGGAGNDTIDGGAGDDNLIGGVGDDTLLGGNGNDQIDGGVGADIMEGGQGGDTYLVDNIGDVVREPVLTFGNFDRDGVLASIDYTLPSGVEDLALAGFGSLRGTGNGLDNVLTGNGAINTLTGGAGDDTLIGGGGNDRLNGGTGNDTYDYRVGRTSANLGDDTISDSAGSDLLRLDSMSQVVGGRRIGDDLILVLQQGTVTIKGHFDKGQIENVRADSKQVVLANGLIGGNASGIISGSEDADAMDGRGGDDFLYGAAGNDILLGSEGDDLLQGDEGNDRLDGGSGLDTARFTGLRADYGIANSKGAVTVKDKIGNRDGSDDLVEVERLGFSDGALAFDLMGNAGKVYALYKALLGRDPDSSGLGYFLRYLDGGGTVEAVAGAIAKSSEMSKNSASDAELVTKLYAVWLHRAPEKEGFDHWSSRLESAQGERGSVVSDFLASPLVLQQATMSAPNEGLWFV